MGIEHLRGLWRENKPVRVAWVMTAEPLICEMMARVGFDAIIFDLQHGMAIGPDRAAACLQAMGNGDVAVLARVPWADPVHMQYVLDAGADGVIVPMVNTGDEAARAVGACRYPPLGYRSYGPTRARYRAGSQDYVAWANEQVLCLAMIEHVDAVKNIEEIVATPGLDGVFVGPVDLGLTMGLAPFKTDTEHAAAMQRVADVARQHNKVAGIFAGGSPQLAKRQMGQGFNLCPIVADLALLREGATAALTEFKELTGG